MTQQEAAEKYAEIYRCPATNENEYCKHDIISAFNNGAKWQQKKQDIFAIKFLDWVWGNCFNIFNNRFLYKDKEYTTIELLEIFKKEKGL